MPDAAPLDGRGRSPGLILTAGILSAIATGCGSDDNERQLSAAPLSTRYLQLAVTDLDTDSLADLAALSSTPGTLDGNLTALELFLRDPNDPAGLESSRAAETADALGTVILADVDLDGRTDAVVTEPAVAGVRVLRRFDPATARFGSEAELALRSAPGAVAVADVDLDGLPDLLFATTSGVAMRLQDGNAPGRFSSERAIDDGLDPQQAGATGLDTLVAADVSGDGLVDILTARRDGARRYDQQTTVPGSFASPVPLPFQGTPQSLSARDLNGDGLVDVLGGDAGQLEILLQRTDSPGAFEPPLTLATMAGTPTRFIAVAFLDDDGLPDVAVGNAARGGTASTIQVFLQTVDGFGFELHGSYEIPGSAGLDAPLSSLRVGDADGDGLTDLVASQREVFVFLNDPGAPGRFAEGVQISGSQGVPLP